jgi:hypothetical protein
MMRRVATSTVFVVAALVAAPVSAGNAVSSAAAHPSALAPTTVVHVSPVDSKGNLLAGYTISHDRGGASCEAGSEETGNAYRCFTSKFVYDPCWVASGRAQVICPAAPWSFKAVRLEVTKGFDNVGYSKRSAITPWGVQLTNGVQCSLIAGASGAVNGKRINYGCQHAKYVLIGNVDKHGKVWHIDKAKPVHGGFKADGSVKLSKAWFGKASLKA